MDDNPDLTQDAQMPAAELERQKIRQAFEGKRLAGLGGAGLIAAGRDEQRRTAALMAAATVCSDDITYHEVVAVARVFEAYLKGEGD